jgi:cytosine/adenosine deaminase-related metal-dependent hydrolase
MKAVSGVWTLTARWIFPVDGPPLERGTVTVDAERIVAVEPHGARPAGVDLGEAAVLPGLVNAHTHLDLSGMRGLAPPSPDFTAWLRAVIRHRRGMSPAEVGQAVCTGLSESLDRGTTLIADTSGTGASWPLLAEAPLRAVVFRELLGLPAARAEQALDTARAWLRSHPPTPTCRPGLSPHAPYSAHWRLYEGCAALSWATGAPMMTHLAETKEEGLLLQAHRGLFVPFLRELDVWDGGGLASGADDVLHRCSLAARLLVAHGNYLGSWWLPPMKTAAVVYCPRTHAAFKHSPHPFRKLRKKWTVALGTDSLASNPDLDVLAEARFLRRKYRSVPGELLLRMATLLGARALGWEEETGSLTPGKSADLVVIPLSTRPADDPHDLALRGDEPVRDVLFRGRWVRGPLSAP